MEDEEYLKLFKKVQEENTNDGFQSLNEKPNYNQYLSQKINETPDVSMYRIDENLNDGWGLDIQIETRVNGVPVQRQQNNSPFQRRQRKLQNDPNGLGQYLDDENLNEVYRQPVMQPLNDSPIVQIIDTPINENIQDVEVVSVELFNRINERALTPLVSKTQIWHSWR